jgi:hypothetical protein
MTLNYNIFTRFSKILYITFYNDPSNGSRVVPFVLWHTDSLLGNDCETNETAVVARQRPARNGGSSVGSGVFYVVRSEAT